ncbi:MAG TPA: peroxide stress protein YaaA [Nocardioidaceae bacterium]|nr:peroxide stress protein YaaA [Nocardioidaceae bacterium]
MLILLPPSEGKTAPRRGKPLDLARLSFPTLADARSEVLDSLVTLCTTGAAGDAGKAAEVLGLGKTQADEVLRNAELTSAPTARADQVYSGVLYEALDLASLDSAARRRATSWVAIASGLFGLVRPGDRIPAYRLSGSVSLPGIGQVSTFWGGRLDESVRQAAGRGLVVDLRSSTYASFWRPAPETARRVVTVRVLHEVDGERKVVSHFNKATKGRLVRALLEDGGGSKTPTGFAQHLRELGWTVELGAAGRHGTQLDVVVAEL